MTFEELYHHHFDFVWRTLRHLGVRAADLPDVAQDVFVVVHRRLPDFEGRAKPTSWLFRICMNAARNQRRRAHVRREALDPVPLESAPAPPQNPTSRLEQSEDLELFERALDTLDADQRATFVLFELVGLSGPDLAETLEIPLGTAYSRLRLARDAFRRAILRERARREAPRAREGVVR
jgi:RNA polymerase sigma-70 factor (ECF subfamily)